VRMPMHPRHDPSTAVHSPRCLSIRGITGTMMGRNAPVVIPITALDDVLIMDQPRGEPRLPNWRGRQPWAWLAG
jgi:hypothetical protein